MTSNRFQIESERNYKKQMSDLIDMSRMIEDEKVVSKMTTRVMVVATKRHLGNPMTRVVRRLFDSTSDAYDYIQTLDKEMYARVCVYEEKEVIEF